MVADFPININKDINIEVLHMKLDKVLAMIAEADEGMASVSAQDQSSGSVQQSPTETNKEGNAPPDEQEKEEKPVDIVKVRDTLMKDFNEESGNVSADVSVILVTVTRNGIESSDEFIPVLRINSKHTMYVDEDYVIDNPINVVYSRTLLNNLRTMLQNNAEEATLDQMTTNDGLTYFKIKLETTK